MILTKENIDRVDLDLLINNKINNNKVNELLLIVPTNRKVRYLKKEIISLMPNRSAQELNIETLGTFSSKILNQIKPFTQLSEAASIVFIKQSFSEIKPRYFSIYKNEIPFGTLDRIKNVIKEYKRQGITPDTLREEAKKLDKSENLKALDIADIYEKYLIKCYSINSLDTGDIYLQLINLNNEDFYKSFSRIYTEVDLIVLYGFSDFSNLEIKIIDKISRISQKKFFIKFDYNEKNKFLFAHLNNCYNQFLKLHFKVIEDQNEAQPSEFKMVIRNKLFRNHKEKKYDYRDKIFKIIAYDREAEVEFIAKEIKNLIHKENVEFHKICVVFNLIQNYSSIVRDIFTKNGIPFNLTDRIPLSNSSPVKAIINFLEIVESDYYYQNIFRGLSSGYINIDNINLFNLYKISSELKIVSGKENWINILSKSVNEIIQTKDEDADEDKDRINSYRKAYNDLNTIIIHLEPFEKKQTISDFKKNLFELIVYTSLPIKLLSIDSDQEENIRGFNKFIETINEIFDLLEEENGKDKKYDIHFFLDQIRTSCSWARFNVKERSNYGVLVTTLEEIRELNFDYLFIGGLCDGDLPTRYNPEIFSSGKFRKQAFIHQSEERNLFYQALNCWNKKLFFSYPLTDNNRETVISSFLKDFEQLFLITDFDEQQFDQKIFSLEELQIEAGKNLSTLDMLSKELNIDTLKLQESIKVEQLREENILLESIYNGSLLTDEINNTKLNIKERLNSLIDKQYSISQLETYAKCPFKFFIERILGIKVIEEPTEEIEAIELGRILHLILFEFYKKIKNEKVNLKNCTDEELEKSKKMLFDITNEIIQQSYFTSPLTFYEKELLTGLNGKFEDSILGKFIEYEYNSDDTYIPEFFEVSFGMMKNETSDKELSDTSPVIANGIKLRGKIDRIEISNEYSFNIVDYKLGSKTPSVKELKDGISLQLPVYLFAASKLLEKKYKKNFKLNEMIIYSLKYSEKDFGKKKISIGKGNSIEEMINNTLNHIYNYVNSMVKGKFNLSPHEDREKIICKYCNYRSVCRITEAI